MRQAVAMANRTYVVGVGMTKFCKPKTKDWDYPDMAREAGQQALKDAGIDYKQVQAVVASYCYGEPTCGQRAVYELGLTGVPVFNVNNNCSSGSTALMMARRLVMSGQEDCVMALGFEKMEGGLSEKYHDRVSPVKRHMDHMETLGAEPGLISPKMNAMTSDVIKLFAMAAREYSALHPQRATEAQVDIAHKNRRQGVHNPRACFQREIDKATIAKKSVLCPPITFAMSAATADGGAAAIVCSEDFVQQHGLMGHAVEIIAQSMVTDLPNSFGRSYMDLSGFSMAKQAADNCYKQAKLSAKDVDVLEVHDCFSINELLMYSALGLCPLGSGPNMLDEAKWRANGEGGEHLLLGGRWVVNPSGGLESKGHPIGATGLGQCAELVWQLRGVAGPRQVQGARVAMQHNFGIGGAAVVTMYGKPGPGAAKL